MRGVGMGAAVVLSSCMTLVPVRADESVAASNTAPESAVEAVTPVDKALTTPEAEKPVLFHHLARSLANAPPALRDAQFKFNFRGFSFDRGRPGGERSSADTLGGELFFETGRIRRVAQIGLSYYVSAGVGDGRDPGSTELVRTDGENLDVLGQAYLGLGNRGGLQATLYRRGTEIPYLDRVDSRMIPRTQEGYLLYRIGRPLEFGVGHFTKPRE